MLYKQHSLVELLIRRGKLWSWIEPRHHFSEQSGDLQSEPSSPLTTWVMVAAVRQEQKWETSSDKGPGVMEYEDGHCGCWGLVTRAASPRSTRTPTWSLREELQMFLSFLWQHSAPTSGLTGRAHMWSLNETYCSSCRLRASLDWWWVTFPKITDGAWVAQEFVSLIMLDPHTMSSLVRVDLMRFHPVIGWFHILLCSHSMFYTHYHILAFKRTF